jgi:hypothetical protein
VKIRRRRTPTIVARRIAVRRRTEVDLGMFMEKKNDDTAAVIAAKLAQLNAKDYVVLGLEPSDSSNTTYEIRMGSNHSVYCTCKGWQYSHTGSCKHLDRFIEKCRKRFGGKR